MRGGRTALAAALAVATTGLGCGTHAGDLFVLTRSGSVPGADLRLLVRDDGVVSCNGGRERMLSDPQLLDAREIGRQLGSRAAKHQSLPPGPAPVLRYRVRLQQGAVAFADDSAGQTKEMFLAYPSLSNVEATLRFLNLDEAAGTPIPLHPGAARYYREAGKNLDGVPEASAEPAERKGP